MRRRTRISEISNRPIARVLAAAAAAVALAGCAGTQQIGRNAYAIQADFGGDLSYQDSVDTLTARANRTCAKGYRKLHDFVTDDGGRQVLVWQITCLGIHPRDLEEYTDVRD